MNIWNYPIKAVIFDNDGTILDTLGLYYDALSEIVPPPFSDELIRSINGLSDIEVSKKIVQYYNLSFTPEEFCEKRQEILRKILPDCKLIPGIDNIIKKIHKMNIPMAVATSSNRKAHEIKIFKHKDIFSLFQITICGDEVKEAKPSPEIFLTAAQKLGNFDPKNILVIEDALLGIKAANLAGMASIFFNYEKNDIQKALNDYSVKPNLIIETFEDFPFEKFIWEP